MIPESPLSFEGMTSTLTEEQLDAELEKGYADIAAGRTYEAKSFFDSIRRDYDYSTLLYRFCSAHKPILALL